MAKYVNANAEVVSKAQALLVNTAAARGLQNVLKTNLGEWSGVEWNGVAPRLASGYLA
jgi:hypothetical protein